MNEPEVNQIPPDVVILNERYGEHINQFKLSGTQENQLSSTDEVEIIYEKKNGETSHPKLPAFERTATEFSNNSYVTAIPGTSKNPVFSQRPCNSLLLNINKNAGTNICTNVSLKRKADVLEKLTLVKSKKFLGNSKINKTDISIESEVNLKARDSAENKMIEFEHCQQKKIEEERKMCEFRFNTFKTQMMEKLEEDLVCNICTELFIEPAVLNCSHTFCEYCITEWKKEKRQCPVCRKHIKSETRVLALDHFIDNALEALSPEQKEKRKEIISHRKKSKKSKTVEHCVGQRLSAANVPLSPELVRGLVEHIQLFIQHFRNEMSEIY